MTEEVKCYAVVGDYGSYSDYCTWIVRIFLTEKEANGFASRLLTTKGIREHDAYWRNNDPSPDVRYNVNEIPLGSMTALAPVCVRDLPISDLTTQGMSTAIFRDNPNILRVGETYIGNNKFETQALTTNGKSYPIDLDKFETLGDLMDFCRKLEP